jgi:hypothetical protein
MMPALALLAWSASVLPGAPPAALYYDAAMPPVRFAASEIRGACPGLS